jgi:hypothetical protein
VYWLSVDQPLPAGKYVPGAQLYEFTLNCAVALAVPLLTPKSPIVHDAPVVITSPTAAIAGVAITNAAILVKTIFVCLIGFTPFASVLVFCYFFRSPPPPCGSPAPVGRNQSGKRKKPPEKYQAVGG